MSETPQTETDYPKRQVKDEIELIDYLLVLWKWKYLILGGTIGVALLAGIISYSLFELSPKVYRARMIMEPYFKKTQEKRARAIEPVSASNLKRLIEGELRYDILDFVKTSTDTGGPTPFKLKAWVAQREMLALDYEGLDADKVIQRLNRVGEFLENWYDVYWKNVVHSQYADRISEKKKELARLRATEQVQKDKYDHLILDKEKRVAELTNEEKEIKNKLPSIRRKISGLRSRNEVTKENIELLETQKSILSSMKNEDRILIYTNLLQHALDLEDRYYARIDDLNRQMDSENKRLRKIREEKDETQQWLNTFENIEDSLTRMYFLQPILNLKYTVSTETEDTETVKSVVQTMPVVEPKLYQIRSNIDAVSKQIEVLEREAGDVESVKIVQEPYAYLVTKNTTARNMALATIMGFFVMLFLVFFIEYLKKYRDRFRR